MAKTPKKPTPKAETGPLVPPVAAPARGGAPKDNRNAIRHGLKTGKLPAAAAYVENQMNALRRQLEDAVLAVKGEISLPDAAAIQTAVKWERHGALALRWLRVEGDSLSAADKLRFSGEIAKASDQRDKAIRTLGLDNVKQKNPWEIDVNATEPTEGTTDD